MLSPFADDRSLFRIIRAAQQAPSVYNTQPWTFWIRADDRIELRANIADAPDRRPDRRLKVIDPGSRELAISCGAALFNLRMALRVTGHEVAVWMLPDLDGDPTLLASVEVVTGRVRPPTAEEQELYDAIPDRYTYRWPFTGHRVHANILTEMTLAAAREMGWLRVLYPFQVTRWVHTAEAAEQQFARDSGYVDELRQWTTGAHGGLGVPENTYGPLPISAHPPIREFNSHWGDARSPEKFESHPQLLALATDGDRPLDWLRAGQALQRALLTATRYDVAASFLTQSLELADHRDEQRDWPSAWTFHEIPQMIIRVGHPDHSRRVPMSPREYSPDVLDFRSHPPRRVLPPRVSRSERELASRWHHAHRRLPG